MSVAELETAVEKLPPHALDEFASWFEEFIADQWDRKFEADVNSGKLDHLAKKADVDFEAGRCTVL